MLQHELPYRLFKIAGHKHAASGPALHRRPGPEANPDHALISSAFRAYGSEADPSQAADATRVPERRDALAGDLGGQDRAGERESGSP